MKFFQHILLYWSCQRIYWNSILDIWTKLDPHPPKTNLFSEFSLIIYSYTSLLQHDPFWYLGRIKLKIEEKKISELGVHVTLNNWKSRLLLVYVLLTSTCLVDLEDALSVTDKFWLINHRLTNQCLHIPSVVARKITPPILNFYRFFFHRNDISLHYQVIEMFGVICI